MTVAHLSVVLFWIIFQESVDWVIVTSNILEHNFIIPGVYIFLLACTVMHTQEARFLSFEEESKGNYNELADEQAETQCTDPVEQPTS